MYLPELTEMAVPLEDSERIVLWLDDVREMPPEFTAHAKTAAGAIALLDTGRVDRISLDHDLGPEEAGTGYQVARHIEEGAYFMTIPALAWAIHSANPVGRKNMLASLQRAEQYWATDSRN